MKRARRYNLWVLIERDEDDPKTWVAHCLDLDIVSWGSTPVEARNCVEEAVVMAILDDLGRGLDPLDRKRAPKEYWDRLESLRQTGRPVDFSRHDVAEREGVSRFAVLLTPAFERVDGRAPEDAA